MAYHFDIAEEEAEVYACVQRQELKPTRCTLCIHINIHVGRLAEFTSYGRPQAFPRGHHTTESKIRVFFLYYGKKVHFSLQNTTRFQLHVFLFLL